MGNIKQAVQIRVSYWGGRGGAGRARRREDCDPLRECARYIVLSRLTALDTSKAAPLRTKIFAPLFKSRTVHPGNGILRASQPRDWCLRLHEAVVVYEPAHGAEETAATQVFDVTPPIDAEGVLEQAVGAGARPFTADTAVAALVAVARLAATAVEDGGSGGGATDMLLAFFDRDGTVLRSLPLLPTSPPTLHDASVGCPFLGRLQQVTDA